MGVSKGLEEQNCLSGSCVRRFPFNLQWLERIQGTDRLRILCSNTLEGTSFVVQVEGTSNWVVILRTRDDTSLVDHFKWRVHPLGCSKRTREGTSLVYLWLVKGFTRLKEISRTVGCLGTGCRHGLLPN
ncbi:hypothetical protein HKD37_09G024751 [Glycine soja]